MARFPYSMTVCVAVLLLSGVACLEQPSRPSCSAEDQNCGPNWGCSESGSLELCTTSIICTGSRYTCVADGILEPGDFCITDSECIEGAHCSLVDSGGEQQCRLDECTTNDECGESQICRGLECLTTLGEYCSHHKGEFGCADHEACVSGECVAAPTGGGNECMDDSYCTPGRACVDFTCATCESDEDCAGSEQPFCNEGHCALCNDASCAPRQCASGVGCVDCREDEHCGARERCMRNSCRATCTFPNHEQCESGHCEVGDLCVAPIGKSCSEEAYDDDAECFGGSCIGVDASGATTPFYCTRRCDSSSPPCPSTYECVEDVEADGISEDLCVMVQ